MDRLNISYQSLKRDLRAVYANNTDAGAIKAHLNKVLADLDKNSRQEVLDRLIREFEHGAPARNRSSIAAEDTTQENMAMGGHVLARVIKLLLGREVSQADMNTDELLENLSESIDTVFEALNQLISTVNITLVGQQDSDQTICRGIGYHIEDAGHGRTLDRCIRQIDKAFYESLKASRRATHAKVKEILNELNPENIARDAMVPRLNPMKKSKYYDEYVHKFEKIENWFVSGRFMESFLREFEKKCQTISIGDGSYPL